MSLIIPMPRPPAVYFGKCDLEKGALNFKITPSHDLWVYEPGVTQQDFEAAFKALTHKWTKGRRIDFGDAHEARNLVQRMVNEWWDKGYSRNYRRRVLDI